jgi:hypothetical protein
LLAVVVQQVVVLEPVAIVPLLAHQAVAHLLSPH